MAAVFLRPPASANVSRRYSLAAVSREYPGATRAGNFTFRTAVVPCSLGVARPHVRAQVAGGVRRAFALRCGIKVHHKHPTKPSKRRGSGGGGRDLSSTGAVAESVTPKSIPREAVAEELVTKQSAVLHKDLSNYRVLVLDVSFQTIDVISWERAICLEMFEKVDVLEYYDAFAYSAYAAYFIPAVVKVRKYIKKRGHTSSAVSLSRKNIFIRDNFTCQYCGSNENLTIDHVKPVSKGGPWSWTNLATACASCNTKKGDKSLSKCGMKLLTKPCEPSVLHLSRYNRFGCFVNPPKEWRPFIPADSVRETRCRGPIDLDFV